MDKKTPGIKDYLRWLFRKKSGKPCYAGEISAAVKSPVKIYYDDFGFMHIYADNENDLFFAQGYAHANDRLFQMELLRRHASGRLAEIAGKRMLDSDIFNRSVGLRRAAELNIKYYASETVSVMESYAEGVNTYIENHRRKLPPEFLLFNYMPEPWTPVDSLCIAKLVALRTGGNMNTELLFYNAARELGKDSDRLAELLPEYPVYGPTFMGAAMHENDLEGASRIINAYRNGATDGPIGGSGSNNWVIRGEHTKSGGTLLASDMHLPLDLPNIFIVNHLVVPDNLRAYGVIFPGIPGVISGFNEHIAWSETTLPADTMDLYQIEFNQENPSLYRYNDGWLEAELVTEKILVRGAEDIELQVAVTHHGPVISNALGMDTSLALRWVEIDPDIMERNLGVEAMMMFMRATSFDEFRGALQKFSSPPHNFIYADVKGNIGLLANGLFPIRSEAHREAGNGLFPVPGWSDEYEWKGFVPWEEIPCIYNPPTGIIVSANHKVVEDDYPYFISYEWHHPARAITILKNLQKRNNLTVEDMKSLQNNYDNSQAEIVVPYMVNHLEYNADKLKPLELRVLEILKHWGQAPIDKADAAGPAVYFRLLTLLMHNLYLERVSEKLAEMLVDYRNLYIVVEKAIIKGGSAWTDDFCGVMLNCFKEAVEDLVSSMGSNPANWRWGKIHKVTLKHHIGDDVSKATYNRGPFKIGGSGVVPCMQEFQLTKKLPYQVHMGAPHRLVLDLYTKEAWEVMTAGNSGHTASPHYDDMVKMWLNGEYRRTLLDDKDIKKLKNVVVLLPKKDE